MSSSSVQDWLGDSSRGVKLYTNMISHTRIAMERGRLKGVLWHQGTNAEDSAKAANYDADLIALIQKIPQDFQDEQLPFFAGTLANFNDFPLKDYVNSEILTAANKLHGLYVISTSDLTCKPDRVPFVAAGQLEMRRHFALVAGPLLR